VAGPALREVLARFGVEVDSKKLDEFDGKLNLSVGRLRGFGDAVKVTGGVLVAGALARGLKNMVDQFANAADEIDDTAEFLGMSRVALQEWRFAASQNGLQAEQLTSGLQRLTAAVAAAGEGGKQQVAAFKELGVSFKDAHGHGKTVGDLLPEISAGMAALDDPAKQANIALDLFGKAGLRLLPLLKQGPEGMKAYREEIEKLGGGLTDEDIRKAGDYNDAIARLDFSFQSLKARALGPLIPVLETAITWFARGIGYVSRLSEAVRWLTRQTSLLTAATAVLGLRFGPMLGQWALRVLPALRTSFLRLIPAIRGVAVALAPYALAAAKFILLTLAVDSLIVAFQGGKSVIADFVDELFGVGTAQTVIDGIKAVFDDVTAGIRLTIAAVKDLWGVMSGGDTSNLDKAMNEFKGSNVLAAIASAAGDGETQVAGMSVQGRSLAESGRRRRFDAADSALRSGDANAFVSQRRPGESREEAFERFKEGRRGLVRTGQAEMSDKDRSLFSKNELRSMQKSGVVSAAAPGGANVNAPMNLTIHVPPGTDKALLKQIRDEVKGAFATQNRAVKVALGNGAG
jgi:hypothetical protein